MEGAGVGGVFEGAGLGVALDGEGMGGASGGETWPVLLEEREVDCCPWRRKAWATLLRGRQTDKMYQHKRRKLGKPFEGGSCPS